MRIRALLFAGLLFALSLIAAPANAEANQISGTAFLDARGDEGACPAEPFPYQDYPAIVMSGSLVGCWYTNILTPEDTSSGVTPGGVYLESGEELFVGSLNALDGTFTTTYKFEAKLNPDGSEIRGRCQHKIVADSGTGGFAGCFWTGRFQRHHRVG
jgi:hypothetical protein